ncbi:MAG: hypothetical protein J6Y42_03015 [Bacilli bacterium]|nr:hypothetical protein [Bacilli bacterium]
MKKFFIMLLLILPLNIKAAEYDIKSADMKITIPDEWFVFTRENIDEKDEEQSKKELMKKFFEMNSAYISAIKTDVELVLRTTDNVDYASLSDYPDEKIEEIASDLGAINDTKDYKEYTNNYKYILLNNKWYLFTFQKKSEFTAADMTENKKIIDSIEYTIKEEPVEEEKEPVAKPESKKKIIIASAVGAVIIIALVGNIILKKRGKKA